MREKKTKQSKVKMWMKMVNLILFDVHMVHRRKFNTMTFYTGNDQIPKLMSIV
jgi:hypothetical protein